MFSQTLSLYGIKAFCSSADDNGGFNVDFVRKASYLIVLVTDVYDVRIFSLSLNTGV